MDSGWAGFDSDRLTTERTVGFLRRRRRRRRHKLGFWVRSPSPSPSELHRHHQSRCTGVSRRWPPMLAPACVTRGRCYTEGAGLPVLHRRAYRYAARRREDQVGLLLRLLKQRQTRRVRFTVYRGSSLRRSSPNEPEQAKQNTNGNPTDNGCASHHSQSTR